MVDYVVKFQSNESESCFFSRIFVCRLRNLLAMLFSVSRDVVLAFSGISSHSYIRWQDFYSFRVVERERERE